MLSEPLVEECYVGCGAPDAMRMKTGLLSCKEQPEPAKKLLTLLEPVVAQVTPRIPEDAELGGVEGELVREGCHINRPIHP